jgi:D-alanine--poly(phosphoribitol) ligase subunit 2
MDTRDTIIEILVEITGTDAVRSEPGLNLFDEGLLDSIGSVELLVAIGERLGIAIPPTEFDRETWATPDMISGQVEALLS